MAPEARGVPFLPITAAIACWVSLMLCTASPAHAAAALQRWSGGPQPKFILDDTGSARIALDKARGHIVLVHFFATWCEPCREELPALNRLSARAHEKVKVLAISVAEVDLRVRRFLDAMPLSFPVLLDRDRAVTRAWKVSTLPTTFVLDAELHPQLVVETDFPWDSVDAARLADMFASTHANKNP